MGPNRMAAPVQPYGAALSVCVIPRRVQITCSAPLRRPCSHSRRSAKACLPCWLAAADPAAASAAAGFFPVGIILIVFSFQSTAIFVDAYTVCLAPRRLYLSKAHSSPPVFAHPAP